MPPGVSPLTKRPQAPKNLPASQGLCRVYVYKVWSLEHRGLEFRGIRIWGGGGVRLTGRLGRYDWGDAAATV